MLLRRGLAASFIVSIATAVQYDLRPCLITDFASEAGNPNAYAVLKYTRGFWMATPNVLETSVTPFTPSFLEYNPGTTAGGGKCNAVIIVPTQGPGALTNSQLATIHDYGHRYRVRIAYIERTAFDYPRTGVQLGNFLDPNSTDGSGIVTPKGIAMTAAGNSANSAVANGATADMEGIWLVPNAEGNGACTPVMRYTDENGATMSGSISACTISPDNALPNLEELHIFHPLGWWSQGCWVVLHFIFDWVTKGVFQGERRFMLGPMVDDMWGATDTFDLWASSSEGQTFNPSVRLSAADFDAYTAFQTQLNSDPLVNCITEHPVNAAGILMEVGSSSYPDINDVDAGVLTKGVKGPLTPNASPQYPTNWLQNNQASMSAAYAAGDWVSDALLTTSLTSMGEYFWQSHTCMHLSRDNIVYNDCYEDDACNVFFAQTLGDAGTKLYDHPNYNRYSMTNPGITGLFNGECLTSQNDNQMKCSAGDNSFALLRANTSEFHPWWTTTETNGFEGIQVIPRYATEIYYNCPTPMCILMENRYIRRLTCGCSNPTALDDEPVGCDPTCTLGFSTFEELMVAEQVRVVHQMMQGYRDKYMFHQANMIRSDYNGQSVSLLQIWVQAMVDYFTSKLRLPIETVKFDDLCTDFSRHFDMDNAEPIVSATVNDNTGVVTALSVSGTTGNVQLEHLPVTVPAGTANPSGVFIYDQATRGPDKTLYVSMTGSPPGGQTPPPITTPPTPTPGPSPTPSPGLTSYTLEPASINMARGSLDPEQTVTSLQTQENPPDTEWPQYAEPVLAAGGCSLEVTMNVPAAVNPALAENVELSVNYLGPTGQYMPFNFDVYDTVAAAWVTVGNNDAAPDWATTWTLLKFPIPGAFANYVTGTGTVRARVETSATSDTCLLDYVAITLFA